MVDDTKKVEGNEEKKKCECGKDATCDCGSCDECCKCSEK